MGDEEGSHPGGGRREGHRQRGACLPGEGGLPHRRGPRRKDRSPPVARDPSFPGSPGSPHARPGRALILPQGEKIFRRPHHHPLRHGRGGRPAPGTGAGRRRLPGQALQSPRARGQGPGHPEKALKWTDAGRPFHRAPGGGPESPDGATVGPGGSAHAPGIRHPGLPRLATGKGVHPRGNTGCDGRRDMRRL